MSIIHCKNKKKAKRDVLEVKDATQEVVSDLLDDAKEAGRKFRAWAGPRIEDAGKRLAPVAQETAQRVNDAAHDAANKARPYMEDAADKIRPYVEDASDKVRSEYIPMVVGAASATLDDVKANSEELKKKARVAAESAKKEAMKAQKELIKAQKKQKRKAKRKKCFITTLVVGSVASVGYYFWKRSQPVEDPWAEAYWEDVAVSSDEPTLRDSVADAAEGLKQKVAEGATKAKHAANRATSGAVTDSASGAGNETPATKENKEFEDDAQLSTGLDQDVEKIEKEASKATD